MNVCLNFILIPAYGDIGAAAATSVSLVLINLMRVVIVFRTFKIHPFTAKLFRLKALGVALLTGTVLLQGRLGVWQDFFVAVLVWLFLIVVIILRHIDGEDREIAANFWLKFRRIGRRV